MAVGRTAKHVADMRAAACALCLPALLLAGCSGGSRVAGGGDPIIGGQKPLPTVAQGQSSPVPVASGDKPLPALSAPNSTTSPAALTSGVAPQLSSGRDLRGGGTQTASSVTIGAPQVARDGTSTASLQGIVPAGGSGGAVQTVDQAVKYLEERGMKGFRLERQLDTGKWRCICAIPALKQRYDIQGAADPLAALRAVIAQADQESR